MKEIIELTKEQKIKYFQFCLDIYTKSVEELDVIRASGKLGHLPFYLMKNRGFCLLFDEFFNQYCYDITESIPELLKYKPTELFFTCDNEMVNDPSQFWFPCGENEPRIKIIKEILAELQQSEEKTV